MIKTEKLLQPQEDGVPVRCSQCGGRLIYRGLGEYQCEKCGGPEYDNYGKVRAYLEKHPGASVPAICQATGLTRAEISRLISEDRFWLASYENSGNNE